MPDIIKVKDMTKDYGGGNGIFNMDFSVKQGEVFGIVGTNGSGKTTTLRHLMGFISPDSGSCSIMGMDCREKSAEIMKKVGYVPGEIDFPDVGSGISFLKIQAGLMGLRDLSRTDRLIDMFKIDASAPLKRMSKGMKQKTALVCAFMGSPDIYLLDEPSTGLDPLMRDTLIELILEEKKRGATVVMSSHIFKEIDDTCDRVMFIENGRRLDIVDKAKYEAETPGIYRIGFMSQEDCERFVDSTSFRISRSNIQCRHADLVEDSGRVSEMMSELSDFRIRYMKYRPATLETLCSSELSSVK